MYNSRGDILGFYNSSGDVYVTYTYDAWGKVTSVKNSSGQNVISPDLLANIQPLRYRGYVYDNETGLYYLQSRYYDPVTRRFINADSMVTLGSDLTSFNLFIYCGNNPVNRCDPSGDFWLAALIVVVVVAVADIGYHHVSKSNSNHNSKVDNNPETTTKNRIINDQNGETGENFMFGFYRAAKKACEAIAVHNAKVLKGIDSTLSATISDFQSTHAMIGYGYFGSDPSQIGNVLHREGIDYSKVSLYDMQQQGTYIISFWNKNAPWNGLHTVALYYDGTTYTAYNLYGDGQVRTINLSEYIGRYICGYYLG